MSESGQKKRNYKAVIVSENEAIKNFLHKFLGKCGYDVYSFVTFDRCPNFRSYNFCMCPTEGLCADILILGRHMNNVNAFDLIEKQSSGQCKLMVKNKLVIASTYDKKDAERAKVLGVEVAWMPFAIDKLNQWLDECEERLRETE